GTHVAGTIAGTDHGVAKKANIVAVRVLDDQGSGTTEQVVKGIDWVTKNAKGPSVANMSLGGPKDEALDAAVQKSIDAGISYSVAAGNESADADGSSPARVPDAITVAASDETDKQAEFSNFGKLVDIYAPGVDIVSTTNTGDDATETLSGTSMAAPHVAGAAAVFLGANQDAKPADVAKGLTDGAIPDAISNPSEGTPNKLLKIGE
ncbi:MAG: S8 family peptidase, partial [Streptomyces sp.]|uniref:S8 family peptidase n=1 Tax=Streptomyces sp. TaxID=1931 RepID=UPI003D6B8138